MMPLPCTDPHRVALERRRRAARTWSQLEPTGAEIAAARVRLAGRRKSRRGTLALRGMIAAAVVLAGTAAFGAARLGVFGAPQRATPPTAVPVRDSPAPRLAFPSRPVDATPIETLAPSEEPTIPGTAPIAPAAAATRALKNIASTASAPLPPQLASPPPVAAQPPSPDPASSTGGWEMAARAMRTGDYAGAEGAFAELARSADPRTRDQARLARAQLFIAQGRRSEARPELESLAVTGATALVRAHAADALVAIGR